MVETHDYEPSDAQPSPMSTDPSCRICGESRRACERRTAVRARWTGATAPLPPGNGLGHKMRFSKP